MTKTDALMEKLAAQADRRIEAKRTAADAMDKIADLAIEAHQAGAMKVDICDAARISRPTLDAILKAHDANAAVRRNIARAKKRRRT